MKKTLGIKFSHDGGPAVLIGNKLVYASEMEKIDGNERYAQVTDMMEIFNILSEEKISLFGFDVCVDGWRSGRLRNKNADSGAIDRLGIPTAPYDGIKLTSKKFNGIRATEMIPYKSYSHLLGHIIGAYAASPFSFAGGQEAYCLIWDGLVPAGIYRVNPKKDKVEFIENFSKMTASIYGYMGLFYGPFINKDLKSGKIVHDKDNLIHPGFHIPGKLMSYIALGEKLYWLKIEMRKVYEKVSSIEFGIEWKNIFEYTLMREIQKIDGIENVKDASVLLTLHHMIQDILIEGCTRIIPQNSDFIFTGGAALNIKWNSALRDTGHFSKMFVPPFPNDSGNAIGAAACHNALENNIWNIEWSVYCGPKLKTKLKYNSKTLSPRDLGILLSETGEVIIVLHGKAEIGPRSLGHRSFFADPTVEGMKEKLNGIKNRESFRPVAPICIEEDAPEFFSPGIRDPYMIFEHEAKPNTQKIMPAIVHLDGTSRLQTVSKNDCKTTYEILEGFKEASGIGVLCNTSANYNGKGFFHSDEVAIDFAIENDIKYIWFDGELITLKGE